MKHLLTIGVAVGALITFGVVAQADPVVNELLYNDAGTDDEEFCEIKGDPGLSLDGFTLVGVNGSNGLDYRTVALDGYSINASGYFVVGMDGVANVDLVDPGTWQGRASAQR